MKVAVFSTRNYDRRFLQEANRTHGHDLVFFEARLHGETVSLAAGFDAVCAFVNDQLDGPVLRTLAAQGVGTVALRAAGFNNVDLTAAEESGITVVRVPAYSPYSVAEHTVGLILTLNRKIHRAYARVREHNFSLDGLLGFDLRGKTVGLIGTGRIGEATARILHGFGCDLIGYDPHPNPACTELGLRYTDLDTLLATSDVITLHTPLTPQTHHIIDAAALAKVKQGVMIVNTSRGALIDTAAAVEGLKDGTIGYLGLDVYEEEADLFFEDLSNAVIQDDVFSRLLTFPNVVVTGHQAYFTEDALRTIADTTIESLTALQAGRSPGTEVRLKEVRG